MNVKSLTTCTSCQCQICFNVITKSHTLIRPQSRLAANNNGIARQIFEDTDAAFQMQGFFEEVKKFTDTRRAMKSIEFMYEDGMMDKTTYNHFDAAKMGSGQEFTVAGLLNQKQMGKFKSFDTQLKITEPSGNERIIKQTYEVRLVWLEPFFSYRFFKDEKYRLVTDARDQFEIKCEPEEGGQNEFEPVGTHLSTPSDQTAYPRETHGPQCRRVQ